jgi:hypothetical protein
VHRGGPQEVGKRLGKGCVGIVHQSAMAVLHHLLPCAKAAHQVAYIALVQ